MGDTWLNGDDHEFNSTYNAACFFAGYAVMRWHLGYPLGDVTINPDGTGQWDLPTETPLFEVDKPLPAQVHHGMVIHVEENDTRYFMQFPTPREQVLMRLAGVWAEHWTSLFLEGKKDPGKPCHHFLYSGGATVCPCAWPEQLLEKVWPDLTMEYCLNAFEPPCTPEETLRQCVDEVQHVYFAYEEAVTSLKERLWEEGTLTGSEVAALLTTWTVPADDPAAAG